MNDETFKTKECQKKIDITVNMENSQFVKSIDAISKSSFYNKYTPALSNHHKIGHIQKVMFFSQIIAQNENLEKSQIKILLAVAAFHDCGRQRDRNDIEHGIISAEIARKYFENNPNNPYGIKENEIGIVQVAIVYHVVSENTLGKIDEIKLEKLCYKYGVNVEDLEKTKVISAILKDADALDRLRFVSGSTLKSEMLRTETAKNPFMLELSKEVNQEYAKEMLRINYFLEQRGSKDKIKELQDIRLYYRDKNGGTYEKEIDIPVSKIKLMFNEISKKKIGDSIHVSSAYDIEKVFIGNTGDMYYIYDKTDGKEYYFKPAISKRGVVCQYRAYIQEAAYHVQQIINSDNAVRCNVIEINGMFGAIQEKVIIDNSATRNFCNYFKNNEGNLSSEIIRQIIDEYLVDFCLCNYDSNFRNFIIDKKGRLRGIDKEQSFRYIKEDINRDMMFSINYNEVYGASPSIYRLIFEKMKKGDISYKYLETLRYRAMKIYKYPYEEYKKIFKLYAYKKENTKECAEGLLNSIIDRKRDILQNVRRLQDSIYNEWYRNHNARKLYLMGNLINKDDCGR